MHRENSFRQSTSDAFSSTREIGQSRQSARSSWSTGILLTIGFSFFILFLLAIKLFEIQSVKLLFQQGTLQGHHHWPLCSARPAHG